MNAYDCITKFITNMKPGKHCFQRGWKSWSAIPRGETHIFRTKNALWFDFQSQTNWLSTLPINELFKKLFSASKNSSIFLILLILFYYVNTYICTNKSIFGVVLDNLVTNFWEIILDAFKFGVHTLDLVFPLGRAFFEMWHVNFVSRVRNKRRAMFIQIVLFM